VLPKSASEPGEHARSVPSCVARALVFQTGQGLINLKRQGAGKEERFEVVTLAAALTDLVRNHED